MDFSKKDISQIQEKGLRPEDVAEQMAIFEKGNIIVNIREAATLRNGILSFSEEEKEKQVRHYEREKDELELLKFVPASGAATRMFNTLHTFLENYNPAEESIEDYVERKNNPKLELFFRRMKDLPFHELVKEKINEESPNFEKLSEDEQQLLFVKTMLNEKGADFANYPKGLVPFHKYKDHLATAFEEHLIEAAAYASSNGLAKIHFTVTKEHLSKFKEEYSKIKERVENETNVKFDISYSFQDPKTDTIAVDEDNKPFREENAELFFRPGGHGALIGNLNGQDADIIFIKNIDNVVIPKYRELMAENKKMLAGKLLELQKTTFNYLQQLQNDEITDADLKEMIRFMRQELNSGLSINFDDLEKSEQIVQLKRKLDRPIRICGMVKNEGEPGGGPFWVTHKNGEISLQIVESSQIDHENYQQSKIAQEATHFNPVDLVCGMKDYKGKKFNLPNYVDKEANFISSKTKNGKPLKALELPGLWNGGMSDWISIFVEVPIETFNPVKTVADLLKPSHQVR